MAERSERQPYDVDRQSRISDPQSYCMNSRTPRTPTRSASALIHRGPQAMTAAPHALAPIHAPNAALLIDFDNVTMGIRSDLGRELRSLLSSDIIKGKVAVQRAY